MYVFDVDGCLADTLPIVRWAYQAAGAAATEEDVRHPWGEWLPQLMGGVSRAEEVRDRKTELYIDALRQRPPKHLPSCALARELLDADAEVYAISAAHRRVVPVVLEVIGLGDMPIIGTEIRPLQRPFELLKLAAPGTYYDDDAWTLKLVRSQTTWSVVQV